MSDVEVQTPVVQSRQFKNLDAALDYCRFAEPDELSIKRTYNGSEVVGYKLVYTGSKGQR